MSYFSNARSCYVTSLDEDDGKFTVYPQFVTLLCFSHGAASGLDVTMEGSHSVRQTVMGHYTCEHNNFSLTRPMVTKLGMYVRYGHPKNPIDFGMQRSKVKVTGVKFIKTLRAQ